MKWEDVEYSGQELEDMEHEAQVSQMNDGWPEIKGGETNDRIMALESREAITDMLDGVDFDVTDEGVDLQDLWTALHGITDATWFIEHCVADGEWWRDPERRCGELADALLD